MRKISIIVILCLLASCKNTPKDQEERLAQSDRGFPEAFTSLGKEISEEEILSEEEMYRWYLAIETGDTLDVKFRTKVNSVCRKKGCWMKVDLENANEVMVRFKDYGFFVPKDIEEREVVVNGKAYVTEMSIEDQRHFAEDGGQSPEEVAAIVAPKRTLFFLADGVLFENE